MDPNPKIIQTFFSSFFSINYFNSSIGNYDFFRAEKPKPQGAGCFGPLRARTACKKPGAGALKNNLEPEPLKISGYCNFVYFLCAYGSVSWFHEVDPDPRHCPRKVALGPCDL